MNVYIIYEHPPQGDTQYIVFCIYLAVNTIVLLKKGDVNIDKLLQHIDRLPLDKIKQKQVIE
jgi:hypothetical protein